MITRPEILLTYYGGKKIGGASATRVISLLFLDGFAFVDRVAEVRVVLGGGS
uniref:Uncharacterized protein n=1 Tax=Nelumbo nucifera TaxID=4432 RepID=A0A822XJU9_NELNU|nr:TPA_asm: hypothetical protein HUJ06_021735 [Nelumbo nucifera]